MLLRVLLVGFLSWGLVKADEPLPPPTLKTVFSANGRYCAVLDPEKDRTTAFAIEDGKRHEIWSMPGWYREAHLTDDGIHLITGYDGLNLLPRSYDKKMVMLSFFASGKLVKRVALNRLIRDFDKLQATVSHYYWGSYRGLDEQGRFSVETVEQRILLFDPATGCLLAEQPKK